jgi:hypothetical protein
MTTGARMRRSRCTVAAKMAVSGVVCSGKMKVQNGKHALKELNGKQYAFLQHVKNAQLLVRIMLQQ